MSGIARRRGNPGPRSRSKSRVSIKKTDFSGTFESPENMSEKTEILQGTSPLPIKTD
jgi:hypothetical protein